jgi:hypothetical protein
MLSKDHFDQEGLCPATGSETEVSRRQFVGRIEEVDTGRELRFKFTDEVSAFLAKCFDKAQQQEREPDEPLYE